MSSTPRVHTTPDDAPLRERMEDLDRQQDQATADAREARVQALELRSPSSPVTVDDLAAQPNAVEVIKARAEVLHTARTQAIRVTHPEDWVLFRSKDGRITGYLEDAGCARVRPIFGISIKDVEPSERITAGDGRSFAIVTRGRGESGLTRDVVESAEGIRESTEDFCKDLTGIKLEMRVRQASRANLDGRIVRELAGLESVPIEELARAWSGTDKKTDHCRKGRGFGTQDERLGGTRPDAPTVAPPICPHCQEPGVYRKSTSGAPFYGCKNYGQKDHPKWTVDVAKWIAEQETKPA